MSQAAASEPASQPFSVATCSAGVVKRHEALAETSSMQDATSQPEAALLIWAPSTPAQPIS